LSFHCNVEEEFIRVAFTYDPEKVRRIKEIPGRRYDPEKKAWLIPKPQWRTFRRIFRDSPVRFPAEQTYEAWLLEHPTCIEPVRRVDGFKGALYPFQAVAVGFLTSRKHCLLADDLGLGKTICSIAASLELKNQGLASRVLVFCPKTIITQWMQECRRFSDETVIPIVGTKQQRIAAYSHASHANAFYAVTNYETPLREAENLAALNPDVVVLDEAQRIKNYRAKTTKQIKKHFSPEYRWALTGTPFDRSFVLFRKTGFQCVDHISRPLSTEQFLPQQVNPGEDGTAAARKKPRPLRLQEDEAVKTMRKEAADC